MSAAATSEYEVTINGLPHTMQLTEADAARYGDAARLVTKGEGAPANKARTAANK